MTYRNPAKKSQEKANPHINVTVAFFEYHSNRRAKESYDGVKTEFKWTG
jgi:hypothetical protein